MVRVWQRPETEDKVPANAPLIEYHLKSSPMSLSTNFHSIENASTQAPRISGSEQPLAGLTEQDDSTLQASTTSSALLEAVDKLKFFLATAPGSFDPSPINSHDVSVLEDRCFNRFPLPTGEQISCILWNGLYHITGTDIVRALNFRFLAFGRPVKNVKKFEEGIFSDLRNLKAGTDATLEEPKSDFLELLFKHNCIRTQKKQKVFYWFSVPHDRLFLDALDRDLKREKLGLDTTTQAVAEPALSFAYNPSKSLYDQFAKATADPHAADSGLEQSLIPSMSTTTTNPTKRAHGPDVKPSAVSDSLLGAFSLFEGSPSYKQRRKTSATSTRKPSSSLSKQAHHTARYSSQFHDSDRRRQVSYSYSPAPETTYASPHYPSMASVPPYQQLYPPAASMASMRQESMSSNSDLVNYPSKSGMYGPPAYFESSSAVDQPGLPDIVRVEQSSPRPMYHSPAVPSTYDGTVPLRSLAEYQQASQLPAELTLAPHRASSSAPFPVPQMSSSGTRSRFWTEPPYENETWVPSPSALSSQFVATDRGRSMGLDAGAAYQFAEHTRRHHSAAPSYVNAQGSPHGYGPDWSVTSPYLVPDSSATPASLSFGTAFSAVAALANPPFLQGGPAGVPGHEETQHMRGHPTFSDSAVQDSLQPENNSQNEFID